MAELTARIAEDRGDSAVIEALDGETVIASAEVIKGGPDWTPFARWTSGGMAYIGFEAPRVTGVV